VFKCAEQLNEEKEKATEVIQWLCKVEARAGVEPTYTDLQEIPDNVKSGLEIVPVKWIDKVLEIALERVPTPLPDDISVAPTPPATEGELKAQAIKH